MDENTYCGESNLLDIVLNSIRKVSGYLEKECIKELDVEDISRELKLLEPTLTIVLSKWAPEILYLLYLKERMSFNDIKRALNVSSRVLSDKLKTLEKEGIIERTVTDENPPRVHYALTEIGRTFALALVPFLTIVKAKQRSSELPVTNHM